MSLLIALQSVSFHLAFLSSIAMPTREGFVLSAASMAVAAASALCLSLHQEAAVEAFWQGSWIFPATIGSVAAIAAVIAMARRIAR